jgi:pilin isopeptide linkage protein
VPVTSGNVSLNLPRRGEADYDTVLQTLLNRVSNLIGFNNKYEASGQWQTSATKHINGVLIDTAHYKNHTYTFTLSSVNAAGQETLLSTKQNNEAGTALFDAVKYTAADIGKTYTYVIHETGVSGDGVTVVDTPWTYSVRVDDKGLGVLEPVVVSIKQGSEEVWNLESEEDVPQTVFDNTYEATGSVAIEGEKALTGRDLKDGEFLFAILDGDGQEVAAGQSDAQGKITFAAIPYTLPDVGSHTYTVVEKKNGIAGIIYDDLQWTLNTTVTDLGDGTLNVTYTLSRQEAP